MDVRPNLRGPGAVPAGNQLLPPVTLAPRGAPSGDRHVGSPLGSVRVPVDVFGDHAVSCAKVGFGPRHRGVQDFLCRMLGQARLPYEREAHVTGDARRPADILLRGWEAGRDTAVDLTVVHLCPPSLGRVEAGTATRLAKHAEARKLKESEAACAAAGYDFLPFVLDAWGGLHGAGRDLWQDMVVRCTAALPAALRRQEQGLLRQSLAVAGSVVLPPAVSGEVARRPEASVGGATYGSTSRPGSSTSAGRPGRWAQ